MTLSSELIIRNHERRQMAIIGHVDFISRSVVKGWAHDADQPDAPVSISILINGHHRHAVLATLARPGLSEAAEGPCRDDRGFRFQFDPPLSPFVSHVIRVVETWSGAPLANGERELPPPCPPISGPGLVPILVTCAGRSGSTLLLNEFSAHPQIVTGDRYPYEIKQIAYHAAAFRALVADGDRERSTDPDTMLAPEMCHSIGANPYNIPGLFDLGTSGECLRDFWQSTLPAHHARLYRSLIQQYYDTLAAGQGKGAARFFCEKGEIHETAVEGGRLFFDTIKDIVLVRDPRDLLCSMIAFWNLSAADAIGMLRATFPRVVQLAREAGPNTLVLRYEDLIRDGAATRQCLSEFIGADLSEVRSATPVPNSHRTSPDAAGSIGRWKQELNREQIEACEVAFARQMQAFNYELGDPSTRSFHHRRIASDQQIEVERGADAIAALVESAEPPNGLPGVTRPLLDARFGHGEAGVPFVVDGWSNPERAWVWSCAREATIRLPAIPSARRCRLRMVLAPFTDAALLPAQRVIILINGRYTGTTRIDGMVALGVNLPADVEPSGLSVTITLRFPDAVSPAALRGRGDTRMLGCSLHRLAIWASDAVSAAA
jgi:hypothetical protein